MLKAEKLSKTYEKNKILNEISIEIPDGAFVTILGPSGCGKSTLLRILSQLELPDSGTIKSNIRSRERGFVFQDATLLPWLNVRENIEMPFRIFGEKPSGVSEVLEKVRLSKAQNLFPHQLSGGMKMRTSIARALVTKPKLLFMDEPFSSLDETTRYELQEELYQLWTKEKITVVFVTHSISEAVFLSEDIYLLKPKGGQIHWHQKVNLSALRGPQIRSNYEFNGLTEILSDKLRGLRHA